MASEKQTSANRRNAAKRTGPITENGKLQSRRNAVSHGLTAATVVTAIEDAEEFERFETAIRADYQPILKIENELVARLTSLLWRLRRATLIETKLFELQGQIAMEQNHGGRAGSVTASPGMGGSLSAASRSRYLCTLASRFRHARGYKSRSRRCECTTEVLGLSKSSDDLLAVMQP